MWLLRLKKLWDKLVFFVLNNAELIMGLIVGLILIFVLRNDAPDIKKIYSFFQAKKEDEFKRIEDAYEIRLKQEREANDRAAAALKEVEEVYAAREDELDRAKRKEVKKLIKSAKHDPDLLAKRLSELTGSPVR